MKRLGKLDNLDKKEGKSKVDCKSPLAAARRFKNARSIMLVLILFTVFSLIGKSLETGRSFILPMSLLWYMFDAGSPLFVIISLLVIGLYIALYIFSEKTPELMIVALAGLVIDRLFCLYIDFFADAAAKGALLGIGEVGETVMSVVYAGVLIYIAVGVCGINGYKKYLANESVSKSVRTCSEEVPCDGGSEGGQKAGD